MTNRLGKIFSSTLFFLASLLAVLTGFFYFLWSIAPNHALNVLPFVFEVYKNIGVSDIAIISLIFLLVSALPFLLYYIYKFVFLSLSALCRNNYKAAFLSIATILFLSYTCASILVTAKQSGYLFYREARYAAIDKIENAAEEKLNQIIKQDGFDRYPTAVAEYADVFPNGKYSRRHRENLETLRERQESASQIFSIAESLEENGLLAIAYFFSLTAKELDPREPRYELWLRDAQAEFLDKHHEYNKVHELCNQKRYLEVQEVLNSENLRFLNTRIHSNSYGGIGVSVCKGEPTKLLLAEISRLP